MTSVVRPDTWTPQRWSHSAVLDMQTHLDPVRMTQYADRWRRVLDEARAAFIRLDGGLGGHLEQSWSGHAARQAAEALRRYIIQALDELEQRRALAGGLGELSDAASELRAAVGGLDHLADLEEVRLRYSEPVVAAGNAVAALPGPPTLQSAAQMQSGFTAASPAVTVPAGYPLSAGPPAPPVSHNAFGDGSGITHTYGASSPGPLPSLQRPVENPLPAAPLNTAATVPAQPAGTPISTVSPRLGAPHVPLMGGAAYPGVIGRDDGTSRRTPGYLITIDNGNALIGALPKVAPPVIGEW